MTDSQSLLSGRHRIRMSSTRRTLDIEKLPRYERKKAQTRERIYRAALRLFAQRGLASTTVDEIVAAADVAKGTFFNYFHSKEEIFAFFIEIQLSKVVRAVEEVQRGKHSIQDVLRKAFERLGGEVGSSPNLARALVASVLGNEAARKTIAMGMAEGRRLLEVILRLGQERGEVRSDRTVQAMSLAFQQALFGAVVLWGILPQPKLATVLSTTFRDYWACIEVQKRRSRRVHRQKRSAQSSRRISHAE